jgi:hypothetical protein
MNLIWALLWNGRGSNIMLRERFKRRTLKADSTKGYYCVGLWHSSEEVSVMEMERRL